MEKQINAPKNMTSFQEEINVKNIVLTLNKKHLYDHFLTRGVVNYFSYVPPDI